MDEIVLNSKGFCFPLRLKWEINGFIIWSNWGEERHYLPTCGQELCGRTQSRSSREDGWCPREGQLCWTVLCQVASVVSNSATLWTGPPDSSVHGSLQARILDYVAMPSSRGSSQSRDETQVSCLTGRFFTTNTTWEAPKELIGEAHLRRSQGFLRQPPGGDQSGEEPGYTPDSQSFQPFSSQCHKLAQLNKKPRVRTLINSIHSIRPLRHQSE